MKKPLVTKTERKGKEKAKMARKTKNKGWTPIA